MFRLEAERLGWCAIVALGYEAGSWLKIAVTSDVENVVKQGQAHHPEDYEARLVLFATDKLFATQVRDDMIKAAAGDHQLLSGSCVAMSVAAARAAIEAAAARVGVGLHTVEQWEQAVEAGVRGR